jgi:hypothetical protein
MRSLGHLVLLVVLSALAYGIYVLVPRLGEGPARGAGVSMLVETAYEYTDAYSVNAAYPRFGIPSVDAVIKKKLDDALATFKTYPANPPESSVPRNEFTSTIASVYVGPDVISVKLIVGEYTGGAHPNSAVLGINVDRENGKELTQEDALAMTGLTLAEVAERSLAELTTTLGSDLVFVEGADAKPENYSTFVIDGDSVTFVFQNYQVAAYATGSQEVEFSRQR